MVATITAPKSITDCAIKKKIKKLVKTRGLDVRFQKKKKKIVLVFLSVLSDVQIHTHYSTIITDALTSGKKAVKNNFLNNRTSYSNDGRRRRIRPFGNALFFAP